ncbi:serine/threonine protein kinase [Singulisphaera acidiphila]|uniref:Serine/threonine protein kinase n=1 Tax=Singulisphaera acidiphila (strain ATCC BAA-1392 / DSM 18658 / VKM B-2454 / MOB10) TaxID=886293 RepID=L0DE47_SINAD|nr:serine/threonine-protein kinase [Singulisphaera acidiphila]AGA27103.1 serine/threonine protein kinase [Singulisphaera acidiphila DSM 18658]
MTGPENLQAKGTSQGEEASQVLAEELADLVDRIEAGEPVDLEGFALRYPEKTEEVRRLLDTIAALANLGGSRSDPSSVAAKSGEISLDGFRIVREIGRGGMGLVYEAIQVPLGRSVALKVLTAAAALDPRLIQRFQLEALAVASLNHRNIVPIYSVGENRGLHYLVMPFIKGANLAQWIRSLRPGGEAESASGQDDDNSSPPGVSSASSDSSGNRPAPRSQSMVNASDSAVRSHVFYRFAASIGLQAAEALQHAHDVGIVHRDIKPANLLVDANGHLWLTDFGLALFGGAGELTRTGDLVGTMRYMSPEQALGKRSLIDHRTDVYSLGVTLYELLTLRPAFPGDDRHDLLLRIGRQAPPAPRWENPALPADLETIVLKAMAKSPADRYPTAQALAEDLKNFLAGKPISASPVRRLSHFRRWHQDPRRIRDAGIALISLGALTISIAALCFLGYQFGTLHVARPRDFFKDLLLGFAVFDAPPLILGLKTLRGSRFALWAGFLSSLSFTVCLMISLTGRTVLNYGGIFDKLSDRWPFEIVLLLVVLNTLARSAIALTAKPENSNDHSQFDWEPRLVEFSSPDPRRIA